MVPEAILEKLEPMDIILTTIHNITVKREN